MTNFAIGSQPPLYLGLNGSGVNNGKIYFGEPNQDPQIFPKTVYWDVAGTDPVDQTDGVPTIGGYITRAGNPATIFASGSYSVRLRDRFGAQVFYLPEITDLASVLSAPDGSSQIGFINSGTGAVARTMQAKAREIVDARDYGVTFDGATDDSNAWATIFALAANKRVRCPSGTSLIRSSVTPPSGIVLEGTGIGKTILKFQNGSSTLIGFAIRNSSMTFRDLTMQADVNGETWCATHGFTGTPSDNVVFERVEFLGTGTKVGNWGGWVSGADGSHVTYRSCRFELLTFCIAKDNSDTSHQRNFVWDACIFTDCTDCVNINSPVGSWVDTKVTNCDFDNISQFSVAFAGPDCRYSTVSGCTFRDCNYEALHYEAETWGHVAIGCQTRNVNTTAGTVGSPGAMNGAVQIITGSHDIKIIGCSFDLTVNTTGSPNGPVVQPGGGGEPYNIEILGNSFHCKAGTVGVYAQNVGLGAVGAIDITDNSFRNQSGSKSSKLIELLSAIASGQNNRFFNPGVVLNVDDNSYGGLKNSFFGGDLSTFVFLSGATNPATSVVFNGFSVVRPFTCDAAANWQTLFPDGSLEDFTIGLRYIGNGASDAFTKTAKIVGDSGSLTVSSEQSNSVGAVDPNPGAPHFQSSGGNFQTKCFRGSTQTGTIVVTVDGVFYPSV